MTKAELAEKVSTTTGIHKDDVTRVIESANKIITQQVAKGESVFMRGFGSYIPKPRAAKIARNISKGTAVHLPAHTIPFFKPSPDFKEAVMKGK